MKLQGIIFDWAGTLVDHGSQAPIVTLQEVFASVGVPISTAEARLSMGIAKKMHIRSILEIPRVRDAWELRKGMPPAERDVEALYAEFVPKQMESLKQHSELIAGVSKIVCCLQSQGLKIGTTTGYTRPMLDYLLGRAKEQGVEPDCSLCPDDVPAGRPAPFMCYLNAIRLRVFPLWRLVKIGDTPSDIEEGRNAGMWTIGITRTGNEAGITEAAWRAASEPEKQALLKTAQYRLRAAGADYLAESVSDCEPLIQEIDRRLQNGERPKSLMKSAIEQE